MSLRDVVWIQLALGGVLGRAGEGLFGHVLAGLIVLAAGLSGCSPKDATAEPKVQEQLERWSEMPAGSLVERRCGFSVEASLAVVCYHFVVPQSRQGEEGLNVAIAVAVLSRPDARSDRAPVLFLEGGPGGRALPDGGTTIFDSHWLVDDFAPVYQSGRSLVVVDGRGVGASRPYLGCPEALDQAWRAFGKDPANRRIGRYLDKVDQCLGRLSASGIDFGSYNSSTFAQDLADLRTALGLDTWIVYGVSYGARTALSLMNEDGGGVEAVILDSPSYGRNDTWNEDQAAFERILRILSAACAAGRACDEPRPDILLHLERGLAALEASPLRIRRRDGYSPVYMDKYLVLYGIHLVLYHDQGIDYFEDIVNGVAQQDETWLVYLLDHVHSQYVQSGFSDVVNWSTYCREQDIFGSYTPSSAFPVYFEDDIAAFRHVCKRMGIGFDADAVPRAHAFTVPVVVFSGQLDPITPPAYGAALARDIGARHHFVRPETAHGAAFNAEDSCVQAVLRNFLTQPGAPLTNGCLGTPGSAEKSVTGR